ncbi:MAG: thiamine pyrophosphate-binding protein, partial [Rhizobacter sp.]|nr:thiamine pyrophosphate-binding protein [Rhizobacter sp.]
MHADASQGDIFRPICKRVWRVDDAKFLPDVIPRALNLAQTGRTGAVLVDVPMDVFSAALDVQPQTKSRRAAFDRPVASPDGLDAAVDLLRSAKSPVIFAGNGVTLSGAADELADLASLLQAPVATTLMAKGIYPETDPLAVGTTGIWGTRAANQTTRSADVILAVGTAFGEADCSSWLPDQTFAIPGSKLIQIDIDPAEVGKSYPVDVGLVGDARSTLRALIDRLGKTTRASAQTQFSELQQRKRDWEQELVASQHDAGTPIHPARLLRELSQAAPQDAIFVTDVGWNKNGAGQQLLVRRPRSFITSGGMATMGFSPAAAIGAKLGAPTRKVIGLVGDGGLTSVLGSLATAVELDVAVVWVLFNNFCFSTIQTVGATYFDNTYGTRFTNPEGDAYNPDFMLLAKAFGIDSMLVTSPHELRAGLDHALAQNKPFLLEVRTRGDLPMPRTGYWDIADFLKGGNVLE